MTTEKTTEDQEPKTAAEQGESADETGSEDQSSSASTDDTASGKPGENDGDGKDGDELSTLKAELKTKDETITRMQDETGRTALAAQIATLNEADDRAADADSKAIEDGNLSAVDATKAKNDRREVTQSKIETYRDKVKDYREREAQAIDNAILHRHAEAQRIGKEFDVDTDVLNEDLTLTSPAEMKIKARELQLDDREKKAKGTDKFDSGQRGAASLDVDKMTPMEKIRTGV